MSVQPKDREKVRGYVDIIVCFRDLTILLKIAFVILKEKAGLNSRVSVIKLPQCKQTLHNSHYRHFPLGPLGYFWGEENIIHTHTQTHTHTHTHIYIYIFVIRAYHFF